MNEWKYSTQYIVCASDLKPKWPVFRALKIGPACRGVRSKGKLFLRIFLFWCSKADSFKLPLRWIPNKPLNNSLGAVICNAFNRLINNNEIPCLPMQDATYNLIIKWNWIGFKRDGILIPLKHVPMPKLL